MSALPDLSPYGVDTAAGLRQLDCDAALYRRFLSAFASDDSVARLRSALSEGDAKDAFDRAHELKGLCAQLGLSRLAACADTLCETLRDPGDASLSRARALLPGLLRAYRQTLRAIALSGAQGA